MTRSSRRRQWRPWWFRRAVWSFAGLAPVVVVCWYTWLLTIPARMRTTSDIRITTLPRHGVADPRSSPVSIEGAWGDIFEPNAGHTERAYNVVVVSATLDPLSRLGDVIMWESNRLVRESLRQAARDPAVADLMVRNLVERMMTTNSEFVRRIETMPIESLSGPYVASLCNPLIDSVPPDSELGKRGVQLLAVVPLFNSARVPPGEARVRLRRNVRIAAGRVVHQLSLREKTYRDFQMFGIAFPALAGTETRADSDRFLTYSDSFREILAGVKGRELPTSVESIHLVAWQQLEIESRAEALAAVQALTDLYGEEKVRQGMAPLVAILIVLSFCAGYVGGWPTKPLTQKRVLGYRTATFVVFVLVGVFDSGKKSSGVIGATIVWTTEHLRFPGTLFIVTVLSFIATYLGFRLAPELADTQEKNDREVNAR